MSLTAKDVETITRLLEASSFDELVLEADGMKLSLRRHGAAPALTHAPAHSPPAPLPAAAVQAAPVLKPAPAPTPAAAAAPDPGLLTAPLLGTFYRAPRPGAPPFVEVGSPVEPDTVVGIIEVMKLMNAVRAGRRGRVTEILAADAALVEYGEGLMRIETPA